MAESIKETSNKLIIDLNLESINVRLRKSRIVESKNKDPALLANLPTFTPKNRGPDFFARFFGIVLPNLYQLFLSIKKSGKNALESKIEDIAHLVSFSNL